MHTPRIILFLAACAWAIGGLTLARVEASNWTVSSLGSMALDTSAVSVSGMSGVTYVGPSPTSGLHRFLTVQDNGGPLITVDVGFSATGSLVSAKAVDDLQLSESLDFEGVAYTDPNRNSVFISNENNPGLREYRLSDGVFEQSVAIPAVFANILGNRGFESLARHPAGSMMWVANEEALSVDGSAATLSDPTTVRILEMAVTGNSVAAGPQYAYEVDPIHGGFSTNSSTRSGLAELLAMPDGTLLALERSAAITIPPFESRIYEIDFEGATDVSLSPYDTGLLNETFTFVSKTLLWSGQAGGGLGQNLEGLALGPQRANGSWTVLGVVDNGGSGDNTILSFSLSPNPSADFDEDGDVDGRDFLAWQEGFGTGPGALHAQGDADRDGDVDRDDLSQWESSLALVAAVHAVPESATATLAFFAGFSLVLCRPSRMAPR